MNPQKRLFDAIYPQPTIPAITLWQPWATWIAAGLKTIETRRHDRFYRLAGHRIAIHAGKHFDNWSLRIASGYRGKMFCVWQELWPDLKADPLGCVVCTAMVKEARWLTGADSPAALYPCGPNRFGLVLGNIRVLPEPLPWCGGRGIWQLPIDALTPGPAAVHEIVEGLAP